MGQVELQAVGARLLAEAWALVAAFPDAASLRALPVSEAPNGRASGRTDLLRAALTYLRNEMLLVRDGTAGGLTVLKDEMANTERVLAELQ